MKKIVFLGAKNIGYDCLLYLNENSKKLGYKIVGVLTNKRGKEIINYCSENYLPLLNDLDEYLLLEHVDIAISIQYHEILKKKHIKKAKDIIVNLHMAPLPEYRGCNQFTFAILDDAKEFGTTIHKLEEGIDSGGIISEKRFSIPKNVWVKELYDKTYSKSLELFKETLPALINEEYKIKPQNKYLGFRTTSLHFRKEINDVKKLSLSWTKDKIEKYVRSSYMPGFEPPFFLIDGKKVLLKLEND